MDLNYKDLLALFLIALVALGVLVLASCQTTPPARALVMPNFRSRMEHCQEREFTEKYTAMDYVSCLEDLIYEAAFCQGSTRDARD